MGGGAHPGPAAASSCGRRCAQSCCHEDRERKDGRHSGAPFEPRTCVAAAVPGCTPDDVAITIVEEMSYLGVITEDHFVPRLDRAVAGVLFLATERKSGVEATDVCQGRSTPEHVGTRQRSHRTRGGAIGRLCDRPQIPAEPEQRMGAVQQVNLQRRPYLLIEVSKEQGVGLHRSNAPAYHSRLLLLEVDQESGDPPGRRFAVVVGKSHESVCTCSPAGVPGGTDPLIAFVPDDESPVLPSEVRCAISRTIVHHDHFELASMILAAK